jgi:HEAT repeat protein
VQFAHARVALRRVLREDPDSSVRREALQSLARHGLERSGAALIDALDDDTASVRGAAARQLAALSGQSFGDDRQAWLDWWAQRNSVPAPESAGPAESGR